MASRRDKAESAVEAELRKSAGAAYRDLRRRVAEAARDPASEPDVLRATVNQENFYWLWDRFRDLKDWGLNVLQVSDARVLTGSLDIARLEAAVTAVLRKHRVLSSRFFSEGRKVFRKLADPGPEFQATTLDVPVADGLAKATDQYVTTVREGINIERGPVIKIRCWSWGNRQHLLAIVASHLVMDRGAFPLLWAEIEAHYESAGSRVLSTPFWVYAQWLLEVCGEPHRVMLDQVWASEVGDVPDLADALAPVESTASVSDAPVTNRSWELTLDEPWVSRARSLVQASGPILPATILAAYAIGLDETRHLAASVAISTDLRLRCPQFARTIGYLSENVPVRLDVSSGATLPEAVAEVMSRLSWALTLPPGPSDGWRGTLVISLGASAQDRKPYLGCESAPAGQDLWRLLPITPSRMRMRITARFGAATVTRAIIRREAVDEVLTNQLFVRTSEVLQAVSR